MKRRTDFKLEVSDARALDSMSTPVCIALVLAHTGRSHTDIGSILYLPRGTVKSRIHRGREQILKARASEGK